MFTKKNILLVSGGGVFGSLFSGILSADVPISSCGFEMTASCNIALVFLLLAIFIPILFFSLLTYRMKEETFLLWKNFTFIYLFIYLFIIAVNPWLHADFSPFEKKTAFMVLVPLYFLISLILIIYKSIKLRGK